MEPTILCLHSSADLYGSDRSLFRLVSSSLPYRFIVVLPYRGPLTQELENAGIRVITLPLAVIRRSLFNPLGLVRLAWSCVQQFYSLRRLIKEENVGLVLANTTAVLGGEWVAKCAAVPYIQYVREIIEKPAFVAKFFSMRTLWAERVVCVSEGTRKNFVSQFPPISERTEVIHNGIHVGRFADGDREKVRQELNIGRDELVFGTLGRISPFKGMDFFLDGAIEFLNRDPKKQVTFLIVGSAFQGQEWREEELETRIRDSGLSHQIKRIAFREDVADVMAALDVFVLPSMQPDPFPTVVLEAMASGKPVIGTNFGGVPEMVVSDQRVAEAQGPVIEKLTGVLVEAGNVPELAHAIQVLVDDSELRLNMGQDGKARCNERFTVERYYKNASRLFEGCLK
ncbi:MAG: glycosyltransferase family 4 protein [Verrucomicrobiota bacterium]